MRQTKNRPSVSGPRRGLVAAAVLLAVASAVPQFSMQRWLGVEQERIPAARIAAAQEGPPASRAFLPLLGPDSMTGLAPVAHSLPEAPDDGSIRDLSLAPAGDVLAAADLFYGLRLFDVSNPASPRELSRLPAFLAPRPAPADQGVGFTALTIAGSYVYASPAFNYVTVFDISDPVRPYQVAAPESPSMYEPYGFHAVPAWDRLFAVHGPWDEIAVLDISRRSRPILDRALPQPDGCMQGSVFNRFFTHRERVIFVTDCRLYVLSFDPIADAVSRLVFPLAVSGWDASLSAELDLLYVAGAFGGLEVIDVSDIDHPRRVRVVEPEDFPFNSIELNDRGAGVAYSQNRARTIDASDPKALRLGSSASPGLSDGEGSLYRMIVDDQTVYATVDPGSGQELWIFEMESGNRLRLRSRTR